MYEIIMCTVIIVFLIISKKLITKLYNKNKKVNLLDNNSNIVRYCKSKKKGK
jgi:hypothetical protein